MLGGAAAACPLVARAQQTEPMRRIGVVIARLENDPVGQAESGPQGSTEKERAELLDMAIFWDFLANHYSQQHPRNCE